MYILQLSKKHKIILSAFITLFLFLLLPHLSAAKMYNVEGGHWWDIKKIPLNRLFKYREAVFNVSNIEPNLHNRWISSVVVEFKSKEPMNDDIGVVTRITQRFYYFISRRDVNFHKIIHSKSIDHYNFRTKKIVKRFSPKVFKTLHYRQNYIVFNLKPDKFNKVVTVFVNGDELGRVKYSGDEIKGVVFFRLVGIKAEVNVKLSKN
jgi:hypothetical protein